MVEVDADASVTVSVTVVALSPSVVETLAMEIAGASSLTIVIAALVRLSVRPTGLEKTR